MKILFVAPEVVPFAKTGGLADVAGALPKALAQLGHDVRLILPRYRSVHQEKFQLKKALERYSVSVGPKSVEASVFEATMPSTNVMAYFVEQPSYFDRQDLYQEHGQDFPDNLERFSFLAQAVLNAIPQFEWRPDIIHCHDWQTALVCAHLALGRSEDPFWQPVRSVLTIHNLAYQGIFAPELFSITNLPQRAFHIEGLEFYGKINCLKGGLVFADLLSTVSPTYAKEIQSSELGCGLDGILTLRREDLVGILNGIDIEEWNPETDPHIIAHYGVKELAGKSVCKLALQQGQQLPQHHVPLIGMIQRLVEQKGVDIFVEAAEELMKLPVQFVLLGTGDPSYHEKLTDIAKRFPDRLSINLRFDNALAHQIQAGSDVSLIPSRFEPCGLSQMYSMRYGTIPIARRVGGLADTVVDVSPETLQAKTACGFVFEDYSAKALSLVVKRALAAFRDHGLWEDLTQSGMQRDFSWSRSARDYVRLYERALNSPRKHPQLTV